MAVRAFTTEQLLPGVWTLDRDEHGWIAVLAASVRLKVYNGMQAPLKRRVDGKREEEKEVGEGKVEIEKQWNLAEYQEGSADCAEISAPSACFL